MKKTLLTLATFLVITLQSHSQEIAPRIKWRFKTDGSIRSSAVMNETNVYFGNSAGNIYCLDRSGNLIWQYNTESAIVSSPALSESSVIVINRDNVIFSLNNKTGELNWKYETGTTLESKIGGWKYFAASPVISDNSVYVGSGDGYLYALDLEKGTLNWKYQTSKRIRAAGLVDGNTIYQPSNDGHIHAVNRKNGKLLWKFATVGSNENPNDPFAPMKRGMYDRPSLKDNILIFGTRDGRTYAVDTKTQEKKWEFTYGSTWAMANTVEENTVYMGWSTNNVVCAIDIESGKEKWKIFNGSHVYTKPLIIDESLYYGCADGKLYRLNKETGEKIWDYSVGSEIFSAPLDNTGTILFGSDDGYFYALEEAPKARMIVYRPDSVGGIARFVATDSRIAPFLVEKGFEQIQTEEALGQFISDRIDDEQPSTIVFALPIIPDNVVGENPESGLMRRYLDAGGKVVWISGEVPNFFSINENDQFRRDSETGAKMLGIEYTNAAEGGNYFSRPTQTGLNMGMPSWTKSTGAIVNVTDDIIPLTTDEFGRANSWMKKFHSRPGSGFISNRSWAWNVGVTPSDLEIIYQVASYGLK